MKWEVVMGTRCFLTACGVRSFISGCVPFVLSFLVPSYLLPAIRGGSKHITLALVSHSRRRGRRSDTATVRGKEEQKQCRVVSLPVFSSNISISSSCSGGCYVALMGNTLAELRKDDVTAAVAEANG